MGRDNPARRFVALDAAGHASIMTEAVHQLRDEEPRTATVRSRNPFDAPELAQTCEGHVRAIRFDDTVSPDDDDLEDQLIDAIDARRQGLHTPVQTMDTPRVPPSGSRRRIGIDDHIAPPRSRLVS